MAHFKTWDASGKNLVDSNYVTMGLIKSGYMTKITDAQRTYKQFINSDEYFPAPYYDAVHGFTVNAVSPVVFIAGQAVLQQIVRSGNSFTFWYGHASTSVRFYVFDQMQDRGVGPAKIRLWNEESICTLDSSQPFLDINGAMRPPIPAVSSYNGYVIGRGYQGASTTTGSVPGPWQNWVGASILKDSWSVYVGGDCAVSLPWSRVMFHTDRHGGSFISAREGAFGEGGNLVFMMATEAGAAVNAFPYIGTANAFFNIPSSRLPSVTYIDSSTLPIPYDVSA